MNKHIFLYTLLLLFFTSAVSAQEDFRANPPEGGPAPKIELGEATTFELDNGLKVVVVENDRLPRVSFQLTMDIPPLVEGDKVGAASITGQLLRSGTTERTKAELDEAIDYIGASLSVSSGGMFGSSLTKHTDELLGLMQEILYQPSFPQEEFEKIQQQTLSGLALGETDPNTIAGRVANVVRYGKDHPYGEYETEKTIKAISVEDCKAYYEQYFIPNISYLIIVGDITVPKAKSLAEKYFGEWEAGEKPMADVARPGRPDATQVKLVNKQGAVQSLINVTYPVQLEVGASDRMAVRVMNAILGSGSRGRLFRNLREDKGYTYGAYSSLSADRYVGYFNANAEVRNEVTDSSVMEILKEMERLRTEKVPQEFLQETKNRLAGSFARSLESPQTVANFALRTARYNLPDDHYATYLQRLEAVTAEDVMAAAQKYITPDQAYIVVVGNQEEIQEDLTKFGELEVLDIYGNPVEAPKSAGEVTVEQIFNSYIEAIGGMDKVKAVKDYTVVMEASVQGQNLEMKQVRKKPGKLLVSVSMMGNVMNEQKFNGETGSVSMMGQTQKIEGEQAEAMKNDAQLFAELSYLENGGSGIEVTGVEKVGDQEAYVTKLVDDMGNQRTSYYAVDSGLKLKEIATVKAQGQTINQTNEFMDYKAVDGVLFPHTLKSSGAMPFPIEFKVKSITVNSGVEDSVFESN